MIVLESVDGRTFVIFLDQGVGNWRTTVPVKFDFREDDDVQARALLRMNFMVENKEAQSFVAVVEESSTQSRPETLR